MPKEYRYAFERTSAYQELIKTKPKTLRELKERIEKAKKMFPQSNNNWYYIFERIGNRSVVE